jgi:hypothetical protein
VYRGVWKRETRFTNIANVERVLRILFKNPNLVPMEIDPEAIEVPGYSADMGEGDPNGEGKPGEGEAQATGRGHGHAEAGQIKNPEKQHSDRLPNDVLEHMAQGIQDKAEAGYHEVVQDSVVERMKSRKSLETETIEDYVLENIKKKVRKQFEPAEPDVTMLPLKINRRDAFKLAMGWMPIFFENEEEEEREDGEGGLAIYMDVSGSFTRYVPYTLGVIQCVEDMVEAIHQFSNVVVEIPFKDITGNNVRIESTGGTDFDCVLQHALDKNYDKIIIITDGWADVDNPDIREQADKRIDKVLVTLVTQLPDSPIYNRAKDMKGVPLSEALLMKNEKIKERFINSTWLGQRYGSVVMMSEAFKDKN